MNNLKLATLFKALSDETRVDVLRIIHRKGEISCHDLSKSFGLSQPALSHHFNKLIKAEIIVARKEGAAHYYKLNAPLFKQLGINTNMIFKN